MRHFKYQQLANILKSKIDDGHWLEHEKLPAIRTLATVYNVSKISVQKALHTLEARDLIYVKHKSGYFVAPIKTLSTNLTSLQSIAQPKLVDVPDVFYKIMERSAAFDISPDEKEADSASNHLLILNRHISRAMRRQPQKKALYYSEPTGELALRHQICQHYRRRNLSITEQDICITSGCQNSLFLALMSTCEAGDIVAVESPAFYGVLQLLQQLKLKVVELPSSSTIGVNADSLRAAADKWQIKACVLTANFATPTGSLIPDSEKQKLVELASEKNITLIEDDIYGDLSFHSMVAPLKSFDSQGAVILCSSFSKSLSRDLRLGWLVMNQQAKNIVQMKLINQLSTSQFIQQGVSSFLAEGHYERHLYQLRKILLLQREQLTASIAKHWAFPVSYTIPDGGLALWLSLPKQVNTFELYHRAISEGIVITPGKLFTTSNGFSNCLRLSFAHATTGHRLTAIKRLGELCKQLL